MRTKKLSRNADMNDNRMIEAGARAIARSQGHDPDDLAPRTMMCTADNQQVQWWRVFEEQAEACLAEAAARIEALEAQLQDNSERYGNKIANRIEALHAALREATIVTDEMVMAGACAVVRLAHDHRTRGEPMPTRLQEARACLTAALEKEASE
jgi:hypothetical protein